MVPAGSCILSLILAAVQELGISSAAMAIMESFIQVRFTPLPTFAQK